MAASTYSANPFTTTYTYGPSGTTTTKAPPATTGVDPTLLRSSITDLLGFQGDAEQSAAAAQATRLTEAGTQAEADAYAMASAISGGNQQSEAIAESVREVQLNREVEQTVGGQKADIAANGFTQGGSGLDLMRSSYRQGALATQLSSLGSEQVQRGFLQQAAASAGEMAAAQARVGSAELLAQQQDKAGTAATANQAALTKALTQLLAGDPNASQLISDLTGGNISGALTDALVYNPAGVDKPLATSTTAGTTTGTNNTPTNPFGTNPNILPSGSANNIVVTPQENVTLGGQQWSGGLTWANTVGSVGQSSNVIKAFG